MTDSGNGRLQRFQIDAAGDGTWVASYGTVGGGIGQLRSPIGLDVGPDGAVWVADQANNRVQRLDPATGAWTVLPQPDTKYFTPKSVAVAPDGNVWVTDGGGQRGARPHQ